MSEDNLDLLVSDIITDVEARMGNPNISTSIYLPFINTAYARTYFALMGTGRAVKEELFGEYALVTLNTSSPNEYDLIDLAPRFGGMIKLEVKYGGTDDIYKKATRLKSLADWDMSHVTTDYIAKATPLYYILGKKIGFLPVPPEAGAVAKMWYVKRPYQLSESTDIIDIPYRFTYPIVNYVHAKAIQKENEDYKNSLNIENVFKNELEELSQFVEGEYNENEGSEVEDSSNSGFYENPLR